MSDQFTEKRKRQFLDKALEGDHVHVHVFPSEKGVVLPEQLKVDPTVTLKLSRRFQGGLALKELEIVTALRFHDGYFNCHIPYAAIWGCTTESGEMQLWADNQEKIKSLMNQMVGQAAKEKDIKTEEESPSEKDPKKKTQKQKSKRTASHLKRIK